MLTNLVKQQEDWPGSELSSEALDSIIKQLEEYSKRAEERVAKRREQKNRRWSEKEIVLNAQLISVLAAFSFDLLSLGFEELLGDQSLPNSLRIVDLVMKKGDGKDAFYFVEPDILLLGQGHLLMVEMKTRGGNKSSRNYPPSQLLNYFRLVAECQNSRCNNLPTSFSHLIIVPSADVKWLEEHEQWVVTARNSAGRFVVDPDGCIKAGSGKSSYSHERVRTLLTEIPIYYRSWEELERAFKAAISKYEDERNHEHWERLCEELTMLSDIAGKYK